jgi:hypothetical protein
MSTLDSVLAQYDKANQSSSSGPKMSQEERLKKYFAAILPKNQSSGQLRIRILPTKDGSSPFVEAYFHEIYVNGELTKLYDPSGNDNERSPLNEVYEELISTGKESDKSLANQYKARKFYVVKVIDRDNPQDGPKFWRFKHNYKKEGVFDKIIPIYKAKGDITDADKGRDLILQLVKQKNPKGGEYVAIQTIMYDDPAPLSEDKDQMKSWLDDELTWRDVYSKKPLEYLEAVSLGKVPKWDSALGKYVYGDSTTSNSTFGGKQINNVSTPVVDPQEQEESDDDLPF